MPMDKARYPADWKRIARTVKEKAGWICQGCGMQCRKPGEPFDTHRRTLTVHHINHIPEDCREENLIALCASHHSKIEQIWKPFYEMFENPADAGPYVKSVLRSRQRATAKVISRILNERG